MSNTIKYNVILLFIFVATIGTLALLSTACGVPEAIDNDSTPEPIATTIATTNTSDENGESNTLRDVTDSDDETVSIDADDTADVAEDPVTAIDTDSPPQADTGADIADEDDEPNPPRGKVDSDEPADDETISVDADDAIDMDENIVTTIDTDTPPQARLDAVNDDDAAEEEEATSPDVGTTSSQPPAVAPFPPSVGDIAPSFTLPSVSHGDVSLTGFRGDKPVVLVFYRAYWCSACRKQLNEINNKYEDFKNAGAEVLAVTTDDLDNTLTLIARSGYDFPILYTARDNAVPKTYDRFNKFGDGLASAAIFLIDTDGRIAWEDLGVSPYHFVRSREILDQLNKLPA